MRSAFQIRFRTGVPLFTEHLQEALLLLGRSAFLPCHGCAGRLAHTWWGCDHHLLHHGAVLVVCVHSL